MQQKAKRIKRLLIANRSEIAIRIMRAATELGISTVAIYSREDRFALHRFKADESYQVGEGKGPIEAYLDIKDIIRVAREAHVDAIHPGYGFLSENPDFAQTCRDANIIFIGPSPEVMRSLGSKVSARKLAIKAGVPVMPATGPLSDDESEIKRSALEVGYPVMVKATWGGGGRGMRVVNNEQELISQVTAASREAQATFGNGEVYLEKLVQRARHVEVQIFGDLHGNIVHLFERDCTVQRRHQKVVERAPASYFDDTQRQALCEEGLKIGRAVGYQNAGTVEFLLDADTGSFYFIEVNPRIQVEHTVTEWITGIDLVQSQIRIAQGAVIGMPTSGIPVQEEIQLHGHAIQCRITSEDPENNFVPDYGRISAYRSASGFGVRLDAGTAFTGALITRHYDSLLVKVTAWGPDTNGTIARMDRALREFRIRGVATNLRFLETLINHPKFLSADYTTNFIDETQELFHFTTRRDRATRLLNFIGDVVVNGNIEVRGRRQPNIKTVPHLFSDLPESIPDGSKQKFDQLGAEKFVQWVLDQQRVLITDTTFRDAHQSLLATRVRTHDMATIAPAYARLLPQLFSVECWGGATFDVAMRFLKESPWDRLELLRSCMPNLLLQMLLRASNGVGYKNYPDNVVRYFVDQSAQAGVDLFRVFDALNWVENMRVAIDAVCETGRLCEAAICYTGDLTNPAESKYNLQYYLSLAKELMNAGAHIIGIKDMAGVCKPAAAKILVTAIKEETGLPIHFHTHDTSGLAAATVLSAIEAGADAVDAAIDSMSGLTSQPNLGSIVESLRNTPRDSELDATALRKLSSYWESVRYNYLPFEADIYSGTSDVYSHEIPGGQYTNLRQQARAMGIDHRWSDVANTYAQVNQLFGNIVKVTPTSKVVGDLTLLMITSNLTAEDILDPEKEIAFPDSVVSFFKGELGQPTGGFPETLQKKVLKGETAITVRPGSVLEPTDLNEAKIAAAEKVSRQITETELASYLMYPEVFVDYAQHRRTYSDVSKLPSSVFFYGMEQGDEIPVELERGKALIIRFLAVGDSDDNGERRVFFELNGQPRAVKIVDNSLEPTVTHQRKAEDDNPNHVAAPMPGVISSIVVEVGQKVFRGDPILSIEAMKMETSVNADKDGSVAEILTNLGTQINTKDLLVVLGD